MFKQRFTALRSRTALAVLLCLGIVFVGAGLVNQARSYSSDVHSMHAKVINPPPGAPEGVTFTCSCPCQNDGFELEDNSQTVMMMAIAGMIGTVVLMFLLLRNPKPKQFKMRSVQGKADENANVQYQSQPIYQQPEQPKKQKATFSFPEPQSGQRFSGPAKVQTDAQSKTSDVIPDVGQQASTPPTSLPQSPKQ